MTRHLDDLPNPSIAGLTDQFRRYIAYDLELVAIAARERAAILYAGAGGKAALAITELNDFADLVRLRAHHYRHPE